MTDIMEVNVERKIDTPPAIIIGPDDPLDEDDLPGSHPLHDDTEPKKPHLNS